MNATDAAALLLMAAGTGHQRINHCDYTWVGPVQELSQHLMSYYSDGIADVN
ncbi:MAG: hypothetical protein U5Q03_01960 [Bacteroidota bacterium]|nr:hypothetical protein [Bacteroidota bacterium]